MYKDIVPKIRLQQKNYNKEETTFWNGVYSNISYYSETYLIQLRSL